MAYTTVYIQVGNVKSQSSLSPECLSTQTDGLILIIHSPVIVAARNKR